MALPITCSSTKQWMSQAHAYPRLPMLGWESEGVGEPE